MNTIEGMSPESWQEIREQISGEIDLSRDVSDSELKQMISRGVAQYSREHFLGLRQRELCEQQIFNSFRKLDILQELVDDPDVTEIMVNGPKIFYEKAGRVRVWERGELPEEKLSDMIQQIVGAANRAVNEAQPIVDTRLSDGSRVNVVLAPVSVHGSCISIRKFSRDPMTMERLIGLGSISKEAARLLILLVKAGYNIFVSGGTGSGKTTFLNALSQYIPKDQRVIVIEDSAELQMHSIPNLVQMETRPGNVNGAAPITIRDLIRTSLRMRPDRIIVGEVRGAEAIDMLQALNTGHDGSLSTGHGNSSRDMLSRLETMVLMGMDLPLPAIRGQIASGIDILVHLGRMRDKTRKVLQISELDGIQDGEIRLRTLYEFKETQLVSGQGREVRSEKGEKTVTGVWERKECLLHREKLVREGYEAEYNAWERNTDSDVECG